MSDPQEHSPSGSDPSGAGGPGGGAEAQRFWDEYARRTRPGGHRSTRAPGGEPANGHGRAAEHSHECLEWCPICRTADLLRASASPEIREQLHSLQRDALVTLRSLIDAYIERVGDGPERRGAQVEDIPIE
jgi:hypothetical protein